MECERAREALSAALDGEDPGPGAEAVQAHLDSCGGCARWQAEASRLDRRLRLAPATPAEPDVTERVLAEVRLPRRRRWPSLARAALAVVAPAQLAIAAVNLAGPLGLDVAMPTSAHMSHEVVAFNLAFGVALLSIVYNPRRARGQLPVLGSFMLVLVAASVLDLTTGAVDWARLATHAPIAAGLVLAIVLARAPHNPPGPARTSTIRYESQPGRSLPPGAIPDAERPRHRSGGSAPPPAARENVPWRRSA